MSLRQQFQAIGTLVQLNGLIPIRAQPLYLLNLLASPLSFLFFIGIASGGRLLGYGAAGGMILTMLSVGTGLQSDLTHYRHDLKFQDVIVSSPVTAPAYLVGMALSEFVYSLPGMAVFLGIWAYEGWWSWTNAIVLVGALVLVWAFASTLGFTLATYFEDVRETFMFSPLISLGLSVLPPVYYPISSLPGWAQKIALFSPTTYAAQLVQGASGQVAPSFAGAVVDWVVLGGFTLALLLLATAKARWREP